MKNRSTLFASAIAALFLLTVAAPLTTAQSVSHGTPGFQAPAEPPAGTSRVDFHGYVFASTLGSPMPANTQYPWGVADWGSSIVDAPVNCGLPEQPTCDEYNINKIALFSTAGPVQVKSTQDFSYEKLHNEHGMTQDVLLDTTQDVTATIHVSAAVHAWPHNEAETPCIATDPPQNVPCPQSYWRWHSGVNPQFQVRAWLYGMVLGEHGTDASTAPPVESVLASGNGLLVATGDSEIVDITSLDGNGGYERVWRMDINLGTPLVDRVPRDMNLVLIYSFHNVLPDGSEVGLSTPIRINTGEFFPTLFSIPVKNAFTVELVAPRLIHDKLVVVGVMNTPWGSYDLNPSSIKLTLTNDRGTELEMPDLRLIGDYSVAHGGHYLPINVTFVWDHKEHKLPAGAYQLTLSACNYQGSACDELSSFMEVDAEGNLLRVEAGRSDVSTFTAADFQRFTEGAERQADQEPASDGGDGPRLVVIPDDALPRKAAPATLTEAGATSDAYATPGVPAFAVLGVLALAGIGRRFLRRDAP